MRGFVVSFEVAGGMGSTFLLLLSFRNANIYRHLLLNLFFFFFF
jgi:hypothetical protein